MASSFDTGRDRCSFYIKRHLLSYTHRFELRSHLLDFLFSMAKNKHIFLPDCIDYFDRGSIVRSDEQASIQRALHIAVSHPLPSALPRAAGLRARRADMLRYVGCRDD